MPALEGVDGADWQARGVGFDAADVAVGLDAEHERDAACQVGVVLRGAAVTGAKIGLKRDHFVGGAGLLAGGRRGRFGLGESLRRAPPHVVADRLLPCRLLRALERLLGVLVAPQRSQRLR